MSPIYELREVPPWARLAPGVPERPVGCTWLAWVLGRPDTLAWGMDPLDAVEAAGALARAGEITPPDGSPGPQGAG